MLRPVESVSAGIPLQSAAPRSEQRAVDVAQLAVDVGQLAAAAGQVVTSGAGVELPWQRPDCGPRDLVDEWAAPPSVRGPSPGPDGALAFVGDRTGTPALWIRESDGTERVVDTGPGQVRSVLWSPDGTWIALVVAPGGGERTEVRVVQPDGTGLHQLAGGHPAGTAEPSAATAVRWLAGGRLLLVTESVRSGLTHALAVDLSGHRRHLAVGLALQVCAVHEETQDPGDADGRLSLLLREGPRGARRILLTSVPVPDFAAAAPEAAASAPASEEPQPAPEEPQPAAAKAQPAVEALVAAEALLPATEALLPVAAVAARFVVPGGTATTVAGTFTVDGSRALLASDLGRERSGLLEVIPGPDGTPGPARLVIGRDDADLERFILIDPTRAVLSWNVGGRSELVLFDLATGVTRALPPPPREVVTRLLSSPDGSTLILGLAGSTAPGEVWTLDLAQAGVAEQGQGLAPGDAHAAEGPAYRCLVSHTPTAYPTVELASVEPASVDGALDPSAWAAEAVGYRLVRPVSHRFGAHDGLELSGWWYRPPVGPGPVPTLLYFHGGPEAQERPVLNPLFHALLARGIAVFAPNVRGSTGFGRSFEEADHLERRFAGIADVASAVTYLVDEGLAAPGRIGVAGRSYGGYLTLAALVGFPELFAVGVDVCGMVDLETFYQHTEPWIAAPAVTKYGDPVADRDLLWALSPLHRMDALAAPLMVVHGDHDTNVPVFEAEQTVAAARARGVPCEYLLFSGEGHEVSERGNRLAFVRAVVEFVAAHLVTADVPETLGEAV
ncbi:prolyl oligopeptidase family serine peptidase [Parafrankia sp. EUN1f]|uniref:S9 family peptidase n=1 Tax=Parafrankia sp. EUN1f TaxID=102897 RepID=UPI0001C439EE|nr:prolyl oligopeptidase family serine peptidase [Parafrankia sp. EUN1f]EFC85463.1 peptidase S9 prolyl oligopeptidase active site domain protein [Parafrankia sp. EUN1f]